MHPVADALTSHSLLTVASASLLLCAVSIAAYKTGSLSGRGSLAAATVGALALAAGGRWAVYLILWFVLSTTISRAGRARKSRNVFGTVDKQGARDAGQVLANGAIYAAAAIGYLISPGDYWTVAAAAALAAAGADTWATETGTWVRSSAWSLRTRAQVGAGHSGAVTVAGSVALVVAACAFVLIAEMLSFTPENSVLAVAIGGIAGSVSDTLLGAWAQERRWCAMCEVQTEQRQHFCGTRTDYHSGFRGFDNDWVNFAATFVGGVTGVAVFALR